MDSMDGLPPECGGESEDGLISGADGLAPGHNWSMGCDTPDDVCAEVHDNLWWYADGMAWDLGPAEFDADGDGRSDSLTSDVDGAPAVLTDTDGDGRVDRMSVLYPDGRVGGGSLDRAGMPWRPTTVGRID